MRLRRPSFESVRTLIVSAIIGHLLLVVAATAAPGLHEWVHEEAEHSDHECGITDFASGNADAPLPAPAAVPQLVLLAEAVSLDGPQLVSSFRFNGILEHAPPRRR